MRAARWSPPYYPVAVQGSRTLFLCTDGKWRQSFIGAREAPSPRLARDWALQYRDSLPEGFSLRILHGGGLAELSEVTEDVYA